MRARDNTAIRYRQKFYTVKTDSKITWVTVRKKYFRTQDMNIAVLACSYEASLCKKTFPKKIFWCDLGFQTLMDMCLIIATRCKQGHEPTFWEPRAVNRVSMQMMFLEIKTCVKGHKTERGMLSQCSKIWTERGEASTEKLTIKGELSPWDWWCTRILITQSLIQHRKPTLQNMVTGAWLAV